MASRSETILVIDDDAEVLHTLSAMLHRGGGYTVLTAIDGEDGLNIWRSGRDEIALVIVDVVMPRMSGREVAAQMLAADPQVKVIIARGNPDVEVGVPGGRVRKTGKVVDFSKL